MSALLMTVGMLLVSAQPAAASGPAVDLAGRITKVELVRGQGLPALEVKAADGRLWKVWLGSMRYLVERGFNPKAGQQVAAKGFKKADADELTAVTVRLPETGQTLRLRDESGLPLWRGGRRASH